MRFQLRGKNLTDLINFSRQEIKQLANKSNVLLDELDFQNKAKLMKEDSEQLTYHNFLNEKAQLKQELHL